ncbi:MAG: helix-turn-helix domain-containing protein [Bacteroides sp.]|nr:helix-turn-helix domain-containing protein [Ruminococcus flavefaciens]MCM1554298.1 helix-turn-helix domain-containing protein [Bacteroides sp.]
MEDSVMRLPLHQLVDQLPESNRVGSDYFFVDSRSYSDELIPLCHKLTVMVLATRGKFVFSIGEKKYEMQAPFAVLSFNKIERKIHSLSNDAEFRVIMMSDCFFCELFREFSLHMAILRPFFEDYAFSLTKNEVEDIIVYYNMIAKELNKIENIRRRGVIRCLTTALLVGYSPSKQMKNKRFLHRKGLIVEKFIDLLFSCFKDRRTVKFYAEKLCITPVYLTMTVKDVTGISALQWIDYVVSTELMYILRSTDLSLEELAQIFHFQDTDCLNKYFRRITGYSPSVYRKFL